MTIEKDSFHFAKLALFNIRLLNDFEIDRVSVNDIESLIRFRDPAEDSFVCLLKTIVGLGANSSCLSMRFFGIQPFKCTFLVYPSWLL